MLYPVLISGSLTGCLHLLVPDGLPFLAGAVAYGVSEMIFRLPGFSSTVLLIVLVLLAFCLRFPPPFHSILPVPVILLGGMYLRPNAPSVTLLYFLLFPVLFSYQRKRYTEMGLLWFCIILLVGGFLLSDLLTLPDFFLYASPWLGYAFRYRRPPVWVMEATIYLSFLYLGIR